MVFEQQVIGCADVGEILSGTGELGYWLDEAYWGRGIASEAAEAVLNFALGTVGLERLLSGHAADNLPSGRVLTKLGFRCIDNVRFWSRSRQEYIIQCKYEFVTTLNDAAGR